MTVAKVFFSDRIFAKLNFFQTDGDVMQYTVASEFRPII